MLNHVRVATSMLWMSIVIAIALPISALAQYSPKSLNISGQLFLPTTGLPVTNTSVNFRLEIWDKNDTCKLFEETHSAQNLSTTKGGFSLPLGEGTPSTNYVFGGADLTWHVFANPGAPATTVTGCPGGVVLNQGDNRQIKVFYDLGGGMTELTPGVPIESSAYAMIADTIQGRGLNDLIVVRDDVGTDLTQSNVENIFSASNYAKLVQLLTNTLSASYSFNNQTITNVGTPTAGGDAVNKTYADSRLAGSNLNTAGVANGNTLIWNGSAWMVGTPSATDATKLPLAGGIMSGPLTLQHTMLGKFSNAQEGALTLGAGDAGRIFYNTDTNQLRLWNGTTYFPFGSGAPTGAAGGDLTGTYPNPTINVGTVTTAKIATDAITASKIDNAGIGINRLLISDGTDPNLIRFKTCALNQILQWQGTGWVCTDVNSALPATGIAAGVYGSATTVSRIGLNAQGVATLAQNVAIAFPVTSVAGKTGAVTLNPLDVGVTGTAALYNVGDLTGELPMVQPNGKLSPSVIPTLGIGDISGAITQIVANTPLTGGGTSGVVTIGMAPASVDGHVLTWNSTTNVWQARAPGAGADNLGSHVAAQNIQLNNFWLTNDGVGNDGIRIDNSGNVGVGTTGNAAAALDVWGAAANSAMIVPRDTQANRPAGTNGMIRYNTSTSRMEIFENGGWTDVVQTFTDTGIVTLTGTNGALVAGPATVKTISIDTGVTTGQIVQVDTGNRLPVIDGSQLIGISNLRGVNVSTTTPTGGQVLRYNGSAWEAFTLVDNAGVTFVAMGSGMVPGNISATGTISVDVGTGPNQIVQLDGSSRIPAVDGSLLTNVNAVQLQSNNVLSGVPADNQVLTWNSTGARWEPRAVPGDGGILTLTGVNGALVSGPATVKTIGIDTGVTTGQIVQVDTGNRLPVIDGSQVTQISNLRGVNVATTAPAANQVLKYNGTGWAPMADTGMDVSAGTAILLSGPATLKTISVDVGIGANQIPQLNANGFLGIGTASVTTGAVADFWGATANDSAVVMPRATTANRPATGVNGMIRYNTSLAKFEVYENGSWANMVASGADNLGNHMATTNVQLGTNWLGFDGTNGEGIRVDTDGNVGIGTGTMSQPLSVYTSQAGEFGMLLRNADGGAGSKTMLTLLSDNTHEGQLYIESNANGGRFVMETYNGPGTGISLIAGQGAADIQMVTGGTAAGNERLRITSAGLLGVGTTSPNAGAIMDLNGTGNLSSLLLPRGTTAQRAVAAANGMIRYNTNLSQFEVYGNNNWQQIATSATSGATNLDGLSDARYSAGTFTLFAGSAVGDNYSGQWNTGFGHGVMSGTNAANGNTAFGSFALQSATSGDGNSAFGAGSLQQKTTGTANSGFGDDTMLNNTSGSNNVALGSLAGQGAGGLGARNNNVLVGKGAGQSVNPGSDNNIFLGYQAGDNVTTGDANIVIGYDVDAPSATSTNTMTIGNMIFGTGINGTGTTVSGGRIGIGVAAPSAGAVLEVLGTGNLSSMIIPRGTTAERASSGINGMIRYNTNTAKFEVYETQWKDMVSAGSGTPGGATTQIQFNNAGAFDGSANLTWNNSASWLNINGKIAQGGAVVFDAYGNSSPFNIRIGQSSGTVGLAIGHETLGNETIDWLGNMGVGHRVLRWINNSGGGNTGLGNNAIENLSGGWGNLAVGGAAGWSLNGGSDNTFIGNNAGYNQTAGDNNILIGRGVDAPSLTGSNQLNIGNTIYGIGISKDNDVSYGRIGIGTTSPNAGSILDLNGTGNLSSVLVPRGTTSERAIAAANGMIRYNTNISRFEVYEAGQWASMATSATGGADNLGNHTATQQLLVTVGTAGVPGVAFVGDADTGMWSSGPNRLALSTAGTARLTIDNVGNIGIGTNPSSYKVDLYSSGWDETLRVQNNADGGAFIASSSGIDPTIEAVNWGTGPTAKFFVGNGPALVTEDDWGGGQDLYQARNMTGTVFVIQNNGRVGIGTTSPNVGTILDLNGTGNISSILLPRGTTAQRAATAANGMIRYNTNTAKFEAYENNQWTNMIGSGGGATNIDQLSDAVYDSTSRSIYMGDSAGSGAASTMIDNVAFGYQALSSMNNATADANTAFGRSALSGITSGHSNIGIGAYAADSVTTGQDNVAIGVDTLQWNAANSDANVAVGNWALSWVSGDANTAVGTHAGKGVGSGSSNTAIGFYAIADGGANLTGGNNVAVGRQSLYVINTTSAENTAVGSYTGENLSTGSRNVLIGFNAGDDLTTGSNNILIGYDLDTPGTGSNSYMSLGNVIFSNNVNGTGTSISAGNVGIRTNTPQAVLDVVGTGSASAIIVPRDTTAARAGVGINGMIRYNTNLSAFEVYQNNQWAQLSTSASAGDFLRNGSLPMTGQFLSILGTANAPGIAFSGDPDTGIWSNGANRMAFSTQGSGRLYIDNTGNVGIGLASPSYKLDVNGSVRIANDEGIAFEGGSGAATIGQNSAESFDILHPGGGDLNVAATTGSNTVRLEHWGTGDVEMKVPSGEIRLKSSGRVGVGTNNPSNGARIDIVGTTAGNSSIILPRATTANRPTTAVNGMIRYNTNLSAFEVYQANSWATLATGSGGGATNLDGLTDARTDYTTDDNMFLGVGAGANIAAGGQYNLALGENALNTLTTGDNNTAVGYYALSLNTSIDATAVGSRALENSTGPNNTAMGSAALQSVTSGWGNTAVGYSAMSEGNGDLNTAMGGAALYQNNGSRNSAFGNNAMNNNSTGVDNVAFGSDAGYGTNNAQNRNVFLGASSGYAVTTADNNIMVGFQAGNATTSGDFNILIGNAVQSLSPTSSNRLNIGNAIYGDLTTKQLQVGIAGTGALTAGAALEIAGTGTGFSSLLIPRDTTANRPSTAQNGMIRYNTNTSRFEVYEANTWNSVVTGSGGSSQWTTVAGNEIHYSTANVGIGTNNPTSRLHVSDSSAELRLESTNSSSFAAMRFQALDSGSTSRGGNIEFVAATGSNQSYMSVNNFTESVFAVKMNGQVGVGTSTISNGAIMNILGTGVNFSSIIVPRDTTANRPTAAANGMIRYNTNLSAFEVYQNNNWATLATGGASQWTTTGSDIYYNTGNVAIGTTAMSNTFTVVGGGSMVHYNPNLGADVGGLFYLGGRFNGTAGAYRDFVSIFGAKENATSGNDAGYLALGTRPNGGSVTERMRISSTGNVGIGSTNPTTKFRVHDSNSNSEIATFTSGGGFGEVWIGGAGNVLIGADASAGWLQSSSDLWFSASGVESMRIKTNGRIGIGTTNPNAGSVLDLNGTGNLSSLLVPRGTTAQRAATPANGMIRYNTNLAKFEVYQNNGWTQLMTGSGTAGDFMANGSVPMTGNMRLGGNWISNDGGNEGLQVSNNGQVGVGTFPLTDFQVMDADSSGWTSVQFGGAGPTIVEISSDEAFSGGGSYLTGRHSNAGASVAANWRLFVVTGAGYDGSGYQEAASIDFRVDGTPGASDMPGRIEFKTTPDGTNSPVERMRITQNGRVGVGTTSPTAGSILDLNGTGNLSSILIPRGTTAERAATPVNGMIRYNSARSKFEVYEIQWKDMVASSSAPAGSNTQLQFNNAGTMAGASGLTWTPGTSTMDITGFVTQGVDNAITSGGWQPSAFYLTTMNPPSASTADIHAIAGQVNVQGTQNVQAAAGVMGNVANSNSGTLDTARSFYAYGNATAGTTTWWYGLTTDLDIGAGGTINNYRGVSVSTPTGAGLGNLGTSYGVYIEDMLGVTAQWGVYQEGANDRNAFAGSMGIGTTAPSTSTVLDVRGTGNISNIIVPRGTTAERAVAAANGMVRYNSNRSTFEVYSNNQWGAVLTGPAKGAVTCGTGCTSVTGNDSRGTITTTNAFGTSTINFSQTFATPPICVVSHAQLNGTNLNGLVGTSTTTTLTIRYPDGATALVGDIVNYICVQ